MLVKVDETVKSLHPARKNFSDAEVDETMDFLKWLADDHFTFLGYAEYDIDPKATKKLKLVPQFITWCFPARSRAGQRPDNTKAKQLISHRSDELLQITKSDYKAIVHRSVYMDHIGVKKFDSKGKVIGERRFLGLFASSAYYQSTSTIPVIRQKVKYVREKSGFARGGHSAKIVQFILDSYPRDEIFKNLAPNSSAKIHFQYLELTVERPEYWPLYPQRDNFDRFLSLPNLCAEGKIRYFLAFQNSARYWRKISDGKVTEYYTQITDSPLSAPASHHQTQQQNRQI